MGYCNRCGDIINGSKCRKCGGKPVESLAKGNADPKLSVVDRWQHQYADSILSGPDPIGTASTPLNKRHSGYTSSYRTRSPSLSVQPKTCILCHKAVPLGTQLGKGDYCYECRVKIFEKPSPPSATEPTVTKCVACSHAVTPDQPKVQRQGRTWHKECIQCHVCSKALPHPTALDLQGTSKCLSCQQKPISVGGLPTQSINSPGSPVASSVSSSIRFSPTQRSLTDSLGSTAGISTYGDLFLKKKSMDSISSSARPRLDSQLFRQYQKSVNQQQEQEQEQQQQQLQLQQEQEQQQEASSSSPISPVHTLASQGLTPSPATSYKDRPMLTTSTSSSVANLSTHQQPRRQRRCSLTADKPPSSKKTCRKCMQVLRGPRVRLPTPTGDTWYYHYDCLTCAACGDHFTESEFVGDGKDVFHLHCRSPSPPQSISPPPLSPSTCSSLDTISPSTSPIPVATKSSPNSYLQNRQRRLSAIQPVEYRCHTCQLPVEDKCLKNGTRFFHPKCFICFSCEEHLPSDKPFYDIQQEAHCEECTTRIIKAGSIRNKTAERSTEENHRPVTMSKTTSTSTISTSIKSPTSPLSPLTPSTSSPLAAWNTDQGDTPSQVWMHRTRALPKLGGSKICVGCNKSIAIMEDTPGPEASRWHKKCLRCIGCKKQMDSAAKVMKLEEKWLVRCSDCSDKNPKPHYVR